MGDVYLAQDTELNRLVALKFLSFTLGSNPDSRTRFTREAQATAKLNHPNIVTVYEVGEFKGRPFIAMEYVEGQSLRSIIEKQELSSEQAIDIALQLSKGLAQAHKAGIIHRDIKPNNILINNDGLCKILDFGLALMQGAESLTKTGSTLGTVNYMSPEQVLGKDADSRSDIFSFGVVFYEMLSGKLPFHGDIEAVMMYAIANEEPEPISKHKLDIPENIQAIIGKALQKKPEDRYQSISDLVIDLESKDKLPVLQQATILPTRQKYLSKKKIILSAAILVLMTAAALLVINPFKAGTAKLKRVVVVPFKNETGKASLDPLGRMVADWTTQGLAQSGWIEAVPPELLSDPKKQESTDEIVSATGADMIVLGSYYQLGDSIRFQAKVVDQNDKLLQAIDPISSQAAQAMEAVESVRQRVMGALAVVTKQKRLADSWVAGIKPPTYEAYQQYIQGNDLFWGETVRGETDCAGALKYFEKAYALDTTFTTVLSNIMYCYSNLGQPAQAESVLQYTTLRRDRLNRPQQLALEQASGDFSGNVTKALNAAREMAKMGSDPNGYYSWGRLAFEAHRPLECIEALKKIDPNDPAAWVYTWTWLADAYHLIGDYKRELETSEWGRKLYPAKSLFLLQEIQALAALGKIGELRKVLDETADFDKGRDMGINMISTARELRAHGHEDIAMVIYNQAIRWFENLPADEMKMKRFDYGIALYEAHRWQQAENIFKELVTDSTDNMDYNAFLGSTEARLGNKEKAIEISQWIGNLKRPYLFGRDNYQRACIVAILGDKEQATDFLKESYQQGNSDWMLLHTDIDLESLRDYPPFIEFMKPKG